MWGWVSCQKTLLLSPQWPFKTFFSRILFNSADGAIGGLRQTGIPYSPSKLTNWLVSCFGPHPSLLPPYLSASLISPFLPQWGPPIAKDQTFHLVLNSSPSCLLGDLIALTPSLLYPVSSDLFVLVPSQQHLNPLNFTNIKEKTLYFDSAFFN